MHANRGSFLLYGLLLLFAGLQLHFFESFTLTEKASQLYYSKVEKKESQFEGFFAASSFPLERKTLIPPKWLCWPFISVGSVLIFQAVVMKRVGAGTES